MESKELWINKKQEEASDLVLKLLGYVGENVGKFCQNSEIFKAVWGEGEKSSGGSLKGRLQKMMSGYVYKIAQGFLKSYINGKKGGYRVRKELTACIISRKTF